MSSSLPVVRHGLFHQTGTTPIIPLKLSAVAAGLVVIFNMVAAVVERIQN
jgi:hypothetical protein